MSERQTKAGNQKCFEKLENLRTYPWDMPNEIRAEMEAEINLVRRSKYADMAVILDLMMD